MRNEKKITEKMKKVFHFRGFELLEEGDGLNFTASLVSPLDGEIYPIQYYDGGDFSSCCREFEWLTLDGGETFRDELYQAISDGLDIPLEDVEMVAEVSGYDGSSDWGSYELLTDALDGYHIEQLPDSLFASKDERLGWATVDDGLIGPVPDHLVNCLDYEAIGRDRRLSESGQYASRGDDDFYVVY